MHRVLLIGDSIRMHYQPFVRAGLTGTARVLGPRENCESSRKVKARLGQWLQKYPADVIHLNCGLHDIRIDEHATSVQVPLPEYAENVEAILRHAQRHAARVIWATSTPISEALHRINKPSRRTEADLLAYNHVATEVAWAAGVETNDLWQLMTTHGAASFWDRDGVHFTEPGYRLLGTLVADKIRQCLADEQL